LLEVISQSDQVRSAPVLSAQQVSEAAVVEAAAHAQAMAIVIKAYQRCQYQVQSMRRNALPVEDLGFCDTKTVVDQIRTGFVAREP